MQNFKSINQILSKIRCAVDDYNMIEENDRVAVGVSGGKDSVTLLCALTTLSRFYSKRFTVVPVFLDMSLPNFDKAPIIEICDMLDLPLFIVKTDIYKIVFDIRKEKNPCSLCSVLRNGALHDAAIDNNCKKIALGHHMDDAVETFMMNLLNIGKIGCFSPVTHLDRKNLYSIRPMIYVEEAEIKSFIKRENIKICGKNCPADGHTDRERIKNLLLEFDSQSRGIKKRLFGAMERAKLDGYRVNAPVLRTKSKIIEKDDGLL